MPNRPPAGQSPMSVHVLDAMAREGFEELVALHDRKSGLRAFLGLHDTSAGPAFGGIRRWSYVDERQALLDCLRLARAMTWKCALAGVPGGGGKTVVLERPELDRPAAYQALGEAVERLGGRYYTGPDVGTGQAELEQLAARTHYVTRPDEQGPGDLSEATATGVFAGMRAALLHLDADEDWTRRTVVVQGLGGVGAGLARRLVEVGARVVACDLDADRAHSVASELELELVEPEESLDVECDVLAPCALGGVLHDLSLLRLRCRAIAGAANNQLARTMHGDRVHERGILLVPDVVLNAGALILGATFHLEGVRPGEDEIARRVGESVREVLERARAESRPPTRVALDEARARVEARRAEADGAASRAPGDELLKT